MELFCAGHRHRSAQVRHPDVLPLPVEPQSTYIRYSFNCGYDDNNDKMIMVIDHFTDSSRAIRCQSVFLCVRTITFELNVYVYSSQGQNTAKIQTKTDRQADRQTDRQTDKHYNSYLNNTVMHTIYKNHIVLVLKCSYTTRVNSLKFMHVTDTP